MQNKGAIRLFAILLALVCIYQLSFTVVVNIQNNKAKEYVKTHPDKTEFNYFDSIAGKEVFNLLIKKFTFRECQERQLNLGLDLKGGMNIVLEVSVADILKSMANNKTDSVFLAAVKQASKEQETSQDDFVTLFGKAYEKMAPGASLVPLFSRPENTEINFKSSNKEVLEFLKKETKGAIDNAFNILRSRIDHFGVIQPNIQTLDRSGRILVELPGINEPERVRKLLQGTANLEFWETYDNTEIFEFLRNANSRLKDYLESKNAKKDTAATSTPVIASSDSLSLQKDTLANVAQKDTGNVEDILKQIDKDTTKKASKENSMAKFEQENPLFSLLRPYTNEQGQLLKGATVGTANFKDTAKINRYLALPQIKAALPSDLRLLWEFKPYDYKTKGENFSLVAIKVTNRDGLPALSGDVITGARREFGQQGQAEAQVSMGMNAEGSSTWARLTRLNIGKQIAIVLDDYVYSAPVVHNEITGGNSQITGNFSIKEADDLANILKSGKLPAPARIIEEEIVGPSLGQESIDSGMVSFVFAFLIVMIYMFFYYKSSGLVADIALITNIFFIFGVLASLGAVLTLPGLAGIVLTMGMAVDANVLIYERIKDELKLGKGLRLAVNEGFKHALSAILDSNITTLLTGIVLYIFGHGPIRGFASTLIIGILTSLFTAIFITRLIFLAFLDRKKNITFSFKWSENILRNTKVDFIGMRKYFYIFSITISVIGLISMFTKGLNPGIDFSGGRTYTVKFDKPVNTVDVAKALKVEFEGAPEVKTYGGENQVKISTKYLYDNNDKSTDSIVDAKLYKGLKPLLDKSVTYEKFTKDYKQSSRKVGPTIASDIKMAALYAIIFSLILMFLYIYFRFKDWQYGMGAVVALFHDVLFVLGMFSLLDGILPFSLEIDQAFIAAILTVVGYSVNDSVVVFDRIREYLREHKHWDRRKNYNEAMNSTLSRTMNTSFTTLLTIVIMFIFGGEVIRGFLFALLIGIGIGTYSSVFIATPILYDTTKNKDVVMDDDKKAYKGGKKKDQLTEESVTE
jgi:SecD/SecF fusion protein